LNPRKKTSLIRKMKKTTMMITKMDPKKKKRKKSDLNKTPKNYPCPIPLKTFLNKMNWKRKKKKSNIKMTVVYHIYYKIRMYYTTLQYINN
jgi:hypothetical protein